MEIWFKSLGHFLYLKLCFYRAGDVCAILRVHELLNHFGLINFNVSPYTRPAMIGAKDTSGLPYATASINAVPTDIKNLPGNITTLQTNSKSTIYYPPIEKIHHCKV